MIQKLKLMYPKFCASIFEPSFSESDFVAQGEAFPKVFADICGTPGSTEHRSWVVMWAVGLSP